MRLQGTKIISLEHYEFEDLELWYPIYRLREEGAIVHLAGEEAGKEYIGEYGVPAQSEYAYGDVKADNFDAILVPGGWAPDKIRRFPNVISLIQKMNASEKVIGQICHAGWVK